MLDFLLILIYIQTLLFKFFLEPKLSSFAKFQCIGLKPQYLYMYCLCLVLQSHIHYYQHSHEGNATK